MQLLYLAEGMRALGHEPLLAAPHGSPLADRWPETHHIPAGTSLMAPRRLRRLVRTLAPDLVAAHTSHAHTVCLLAGLAPVVHRRVDFPVGRSPWGRAKYNRPPMYVAVSQAVAAVLRAGGVRPERIRVVHDGVAPLPAGAGPAPDLTDSRPLVGAVGALVDHKGHRFLVDALARLPGVRCVIAGEGPRRSALERRIAALGLEDRVSLLGQRHDLPAVLAALDLLVHPSVEEGMGQAVVEAMLAGVPVLVTAAGGLPEVVGPGAVVAPPGDADGLACAIASALRDPPDVGAARRRALRLFSVRQMVVGTLAVYHELLEDAP